MVQSPLQLPPVPLLAITQGTEAAPGVPRSLTVQVRHGKLPCLDERIWAEYLTKGARVRMTRTANHTGYILGAIVLSAGELCTLIEGLTDTLSEGLRSLLEEVNPSQIRLSLAWVE